MSLGTVISQRRKDADFRIEKERIPYLEGYKLSAKNGTSIADMFKRVLAVET
jgi:hypothetical protein